LIGVLIWAGVVTLFGVSTTAVDVTGCVFSVLIFYESADVVVLFCWPVAVVFPRRAFYF